MIKWTRFTLICTACLVIAYLILRTGHHEFLYIGGTFKLLASTGFILTALASGARESAVGKALLAGLSLSWFGDAFLIIPADFYFQFGLLAFLLGHIAYCIAFTLYGLKLSSIIRGVLTIPILTLAFSWWLMPHVNNDMKIPVIAYMIVITTMVILALGARAKGAPKNMAIGAILFFFSDIAVAIDQFIAPQIPCFIWGLPLYYSGQLFLAHSPSYLKETT